MHITLSMRTSESMSLHKSLERSPSGIYNLLSKFIMWNFTPSHNSSLEIKKKQNKINKSSFKIKSTFINLAKKEKKKSGMALA